MEQQKLFLADTIEKAIKGALVDLHTMTVARVTAITGATVSCKPVVDRWVQGEKVDMPTFSKVPVVTLQGGASYTAYPVSVGDYCLLFFAERCMDKWKAGIDDELPAEYRLHDYSDGFALVGVNPTSSQKTIPSGVTQHVGDMELTGDLSITGNLTVSGTIEAGGNITSTSGDVVAGTVSLKNHVHAYTWTDPAGSGTTAPPTA